MRYFNDDENQEDIENFFEDGEEDFDDIEEAILDELDLVNFDLKQKVLATAVSICEKTLFWRFRKVETKLNMISQTYQYLDALMKEDEEE